MTTDQLILGFERCVLQRQICIAEVMASKFSDKDCNDPLLESGYSILSVLTSYFEMIAQFLNGEDSEFKSKAFFIQGFRAVYPCSPLTDPEIYEKLYRPVRCGMYHGGMTKAGVHISRYFTQAFEPFQDRLHINPAIFVQDVRSHFCGYIWQLRDLANQDMRTKFEKMCRLIGADQPVPDFVGTSSGTPCHTTPSGFHPGDGDRQ